MKLHELDLSTAPKPLHQGPGKAILDRIYNAAEHKQKGLVKGTGAFGQVYGQSKKVHDVVKYGRVSTGETIKQDGYLAFVDQILKHGKGNPYLPQIYSVKTFQPKSWDSNRPESVIYKVKMEQLQPIDVFPQNHAWALVQRVFQKDRDELIHHHNFEKEYPVYSLIQFIRTVISMPGTGERLLKTADPHFLEALKLIQAAKSSSRTGLDLSIKNIMSRDTPYGPQLVITDPLS